RLWGFRLQAPTGGRPLAWGRWCSYVAWFMASPAVDGEAIQGLAIGGSLSRRRSYAQIIAESKPPPTVPIGIKPPSFTNFGEPTVFFSREEVRKSIVTLNLAVIVRCAYGISSIPDLKSCMSQRLELKEDFIVSVLNHRHLLLRFEDKEDFLKVILRRSLYIKGLLYRFFKRDAQFDFNADPIVMPIWVGFPMLPVNYYYQDFLRSIAGNLGQVLRIYEPTLALTQNQEAFVCVELERKLDDNVNIKKSWRQKEVRGDHIAPLMANSFAPLMESDPPVEVSKGPSFERFDPGPQALGVQEGNVRIQDLHGKQEALLVEQLEFDGLSVGAQICT
ncbi:hypothetical protein Taro_021389, partial [Colocasia esculenta]|nr:hypothetical protein [Colocasia esculenta]